VCPPAKPQEGWLRGGARKANFGKAFDTGAGVTSFLCDSDSDTSSNCSSTLASDGGKSKSCEKQGLRFATANVTSLSSLKTYMEFATANVLMIQEHKVVKEEIAGMQVWLQARKWHSIFTPANKTSKGGVSAGTAIIVSDDIGIQQLEGECSSVAEGRMTTAIIHPHPLPHMAVGSVYCYTSKGVGAESLQLLAEATARLANTKLPIIIGGDFQATPEAIYRTSWPDAASLVLASAGQGTCSVGTSHKQIDFFAVSLDIKAVIEEVWVEAMAPIPTHQPVLCKVFKDAEKLKKRVLMKPPPLPHAKAIGPAQKPPTWTPVALLLGEVQRVACRSTKKGEIAQAIHTAYQAWARLAETEVRCETQTLSKPTPSLPKRGHTPRFEWQEILRESRAPAAPCNAALRWLHRHAIASSLATQLGKEEKMERLIIQQDQQLANPPGCYTQHKDYSFFATALRKVYSTLIHGCTEEFDAIKDELDELIQEIDTCAGEADINDGSKRKEGWSEWVQQALLLGGKKAFRWAKGPTPNEPPAIRCPISGRLVTTVEGMLGIYKERCAEQWHCEDDIKIELLPKPADRQALPFLSAQEWRSAAAAMKNETATTYDGFHPRHFLLLSDEALYAMSLIWECIEATAIIPAALRLIIAPLIPKADGTKRDLGILPAVFRVALRARRIYAESWEAKNFRTFFSNSKGHAATEAVWRAAALSEQAVANKQHTAALAWDLKSFYQRIHHRLLLQRAIQAGFPAPLIRLNLAIYRLPRRLSLDRFLAEPITPSCGIIPGCPFATTLVKVYCLVPFDGFISRNPEVHFSSYIDDLLLAVHRDTEGLAVRAALAAAEDLLNVVRVQFKSTVAASKASVSCSRKSTARRVRYGLGALGGSNNPKSVVLGIDYVAGASACTFSKHSLQRERLAIVLKRKKRMAELSKKGGSAAKKIFSQGAAPAALYGVAVHGYSPSLLAPLRRLAAIQVPPKGRFRSLDLALLLGGNDPELVANSSPLLTWAKHAWQAATAPHRAMMSLAQLQTIWDDVLAKPPTKWNMVKGPIGAMFMSAKKMQWTLTSAFIWHNDEGVEISIFHRGAAMIKVDLKHSFRRLVQRRLAAKIAPDLAAPLRDIPQRRLHTGAIEKLLKGKGKKKLSWHEANYLRAAACGAICTQSKLCELGYVEDNICKLCNLEADTMMHRIWYCSHPAVVELREQLILPSVVRSARQNPNDPLYSRAMPLHPADISPPPFVGDGLEGMSYFIDGVLQEDARVCRFGGDIYYDGSCSRHEIPELNRASFAIAQISKDSENTVLKVLRGPLPRQHLQTPQAAEHFAHAVAVDLLEEPAVLYGDCTNVVDAANNSEQYSTSHKLVYAAYIRTARSVPSWPLVKGEVKVKAHNKLSDFDKGSIEYRHVFANGIADTHAKAAYAAHPHAFMITLDQAKDIHVLAMSIGKLIAKTGVLWPTIERPPVTAKEGSVRAMKPSKTVKHIWEAKGDRHYCIKCLRSTALPGRNHDSCKGWPIGVEQLIDNPLGHKLMMLRTSPTTLFCLNCGSYTTTCLAKSALRLQCSKIPKAAGVAAIARVKNMMHPSAPKRKVSFDFCVPLFSFTTRQHAVLRPKPAIGSNSFKHAKRFLDRSGILPSMSMFASVRAPAVQAAGEEKTADGRECEPAPCRTACFKLWEHLRHMSPLFALVFAASIHKDGYNFFQVLEQPSLGKVFRVLSSTYHQPNLKETKLTIVGDTGTDELLNLADLVGRLLRQVKVRTLQVEVANMWALRRPLSCPPLDIMKVTCSIVSPWLKLSHDRLVSFVRLLRRFRHNSNPNFFQHSCRHTGHILLYRPQASGGSIVEFGMAEVPSPFALLRDLISILISQGLRVDFTWVDPDVVSTLCVPHCMCVVLHESSCSVSILVTTRAQVPTNKESEASAMPKVTTAAEGQQESSAPQGSGGGQFESPHAQEPGGSAGISFVSLEADHSASPQRELQVSSIRSRLTEALQGAAVLDPSLSQSEVGERLQTHIIRQRGLVAAAAKAAAASSSSTAVEAELLAVKIEEGAAEGNVEVDDEPWSLVKEHARHAAQSAAASQVEQNEAAETEAQAEAVKQEQPEEVAEEAPAAAGAGSRGKGRGQGRLVEQRTLAEFIAGRGSSVWRRPASWAPFTARPPGMPPS
jgi:hypothetical protein